MWMITVVLLYAKMILSFNRAYDFSCPSQANWKLRAESMCIHQRNYSCLYDVNLQVNVYRDKCIRPRIVGPGYKYVFQPNPNRGICRITRYQPFIFNTTGYSDCAFLKSMCSSEGQTTHTHGTTSSDRTCSCNAENGYTFIKNSTGRLYCNPSNEDCSCYIQQIECKDLKCDDEIKMNETRFHYDMFNISIETMTHDFDNYKYNLNYLPTNQNRIEAAKRVCVVLIAYCTCCVVWLIGPKIMRRWVRMRGLREETGIDKRNGVKIEQDDPVPPNRREQMSQTIQKWKDKHEQFICTRAYMEVLAKIRSNSCVAVTGPGGAGKSAIVQTVSLLLSKENGYEITVLLSPKDLKNYYKPGRKTLFVLDDVCGKFTAKEEEINYWNSIQLVVDQVIEDKSCKILFSCRLQVYKDPKFALLKTFKSCECNIISEELCLTNDEKKLIFESYVCSDNITDTILSKQNYNFPLLCQLWSIGKNERDIEKYFETPYQVYEEELNKLKILGKEKLCGLCLCIMFNNQLKETFFELLTEKFRKIVKDICDCMGVNKAITPSSLHEELDILDNTYIVKRDGLYEIFHDTLFDFMAHYFGQKMKQCFIDHANSVILRERFLWEKAFDPQSAEYNIENIVHVEDVYLEYYIDRMISDWKLGKVSDALYNINMKSSSFREQFLKRLKLIDRTQSSMLSQQKECFREDYASGNTPLIISCVHGYVDLLTWLLKHEANINDCRSDGSSALYMGCFDNNIETVNILLENNADVNLCAITGVSPLGISCSYHCNVDIVKKLLLKNAEVNQPRFKIYNMTPLFMACAINSIPVVKELLKHGADPNICVSNGMSALINACQKNYQDIVHLLIKYKADPNAKMEDGDTPLFSASWMGYANITKILLENGANAYNCLKSEEELHKSKKDTSKPLEDQKKIWFNAVSGFASPKVKAYIHTKSADNLFDVFASSSPLHVACFMGQLEVIKLLTEKVRVDIRKDDGTTPLFYACELGHLAVVEVLLEKGADPNINRVDNYSPLKIATMNGHTEVLSLLTKEE